MTNALSQTTRPIDWREPVTVALEMLREAYPAAEVLRRPELDRLVAQYANVAIEEGAEALGQALSAFGYALYRLDTASDDSVFLLVPAPNETPPAVLANLRYRNANDLDAREEVLGAKLLVQSTRAWGQKAKPRRASKVTLRLPDVAAARWELDPGTTFAWLDERLGLLTKTSTTTDCTEEVREHSHVVDVARWMQQSHGISHMLAASIDDVCLSVVPFYDSGRRAPAVASLARTEVRLGQFGSSAFPVTLRLPTMMPPLEHAAAAQEPLLALPPTAARFQAQYAWRCADGVVWLACNAQFDTRRLGSQVPGKQERMRIETALATPASVFLCFADDGGLVDWTRNPLGEQAWGRRASWAQPPLAMNSPRNARYLVRDVVDEAEQQIVYTQVMEVVSVGRRLERRVLATSQLTLNGTAMWCAQLPGLPVAARGYCLFGACAPRDGALDGEFTLAAVSLDDGSTWSRSLRAMQPKYGEYRYDQSLNIQSLADDWLLLDLDGDNFGLNDAAWTWHLPTDRWFAIPLTAISPEKQNGTLHYHPDAGRWFAHVSSFDADEYLEILQKHEACIAALAAAPALQRAAGAWIRESLSPAG